MLTGCTNLAPENTRDARPSASRTFKYGPETQPASTLDIELDGPSNGWMFILKKPSKLWRAAGLRCCLQVGWI